MKNYTPTTFNYTWAVSNYTNYTFSRVNYTSFLVNSLKIKHSFKCSWCSCCFCEKCGYNI